QECKLISEVNCESLYNHPMLEQSAEQELLKSYHIRWEHILEIYENFLEHCYPSCYMSFESFKYYLIKYGFDRNDSRFRYLFNAFSLYGNDYLDFHEILCGIIIMEPSKALNTEARLKFIFRYYDTARRGYLTIDGFVALVRDIEESNADAAAGEEAAVNNGGPEQLEAKVENALLCVGMNESQKILLENFVKS